ncbi:MAG: cyclic nucleotide-binding domain-containing protein, partial [Myxococcales bacterium]|nr:cyclic nucleotide-binding domain-containing protein [Myxococcales bacterium]
MSTSAHLRQDPILAELSGEALEALVPRLEWVQIGAGDLVVRQGALDRDLYFLLGGEARILYAGIEVGRLGSGEHFGELGLLAARPRAVTIQAVSDLHLARLGLEPFEQIARESPDVGLHLVRAMVDGLGERLHGMTEGVRHLLRERSLPRRAKLEIRVSGEPKRIWSGTPLGAILPARVGTDLTVAGLVDRRARSLVSLIGAECEIEPLTTGHWEGRRIYRASLGQLLLEAGSRIDGGLKLWMQQSLGYGQRVGVSGLEPAEGEAEEAALERLAEQLEEMMRGLVRADAPLCEEWWTPDEAISHFLEHDWGAAAELLSSWHSATVPMVTYGRIYALGLDPRVANTGAIGGFRVVAEAGGLLLVYGGEGSTGRSIPAPPPEGSPPLGTPDVSGARAVCRHTCAPIAEHERWLSALGATTVGELARACIGGNVAQLIRVAEGYHEKAIGRIADAIRDRRSEVDVVCI